MQWGIEPLTMTLDKVIKERSQISEPSREVKSLDLFSDKSTGNFVLDLDYKADCGINFVHSFESLFESIASISLSTFLLCRSCKLAWRYKV